MKKRVLILGGGASAEHAVSLLSSKYVLRHIDKEKFDVAYIGISRAGEWMYFDTKVIEDLPFDVQELELPDTGISLSLDLHKKVFYQTDTKVLLEADVIIPVLHGPNGEDGTLQGMLQLLGIPFVGARHLGAAIGMDKDVMKRLLQQAGIPVAPFVVLREHIQMRTYEELVGDLGLPFIVKPANMGSSVGVSKVRDGDEFIEALEEAFRYDNKVLCESFIIGREIECAVLEEHGALTASIVGEIILPEVYSYEEKYLPTSHASAKYPAQIDESTREQVQVLAKEVFQVLECKGLGRVDMFLQADGGLLVNEINIFPGFTNISMYPALMQASGISYAELITRLIGSALPK